MSPSSIAAVVAFVIMAGGCRERELPAAAGAVPVAEKKPVILSVVGTNDLHGRLRALPLLAGYVANLREVRDADGGGVILLDGGDMFQGTIESNANEGAAVIAAYGAIGYSAVTIGNHEFDYGPVGPRVTSQSPEDDPTGALEARAAEASFPFLAANLLEGGRPLPWKNVQPTTMVEVAGVKVGVIGVTTRDTLRTTISVNVRELSLSPLVETITAEATRLRVAGAQVVIVVSHAGGKCEEVEKPDDLSSCVQDAEIFEVARALPPGLVDVIVGGHSHSAVAHRVNGIAIIESLAYGRAFGRVDLTVVGGKIIDQKIHQPRNICAFWNRDLPELERWDSCQPSAYEGKEVRPDPAVTALLRKPLEGARQVHQDKLGVTLPAELRRNHDIESAVGNLFVDLMLEVRRGDVAITNGGGLRADLPKGELTYGQLYESFPFDNVFAMFTLTGAQLRTVVTRNLQKSSGILSLGAFRAVAVCDEAGVLRVDLFRASGKPISDTDKLVVVTTDFLATGGDGSFTDLGVTEADMFIDQATTVRDGLATALRARAKRGKRELLESSVFDPDRPRISYPGKRPVTCP